MSKNNEYPKQMPKFESRAESWDTYKKTPIGIWDDWVRGLAVKAKTINKPLYHLSTEGNHPGIWKTPNPIKDKKTLPDLSKEHGAWYIGFETLPLGVCTSPTFQGAWIGLYPNISVWFDKQSKYVDVGNLFLYEARPKPNALIITHEVMTEYFLVWDAHASEEHRFIDDVQMELVSLVTFRNTADISKRKKIVIECFNDPVLSKKENFYAYIPPLDIITINPIPNKRNKHMSIYSSESFEVPFGAITITTSNAEIMQQLSMEAINNPIGIMSTSISNKFTTLLTNIAGFNKELKEKLAGTSRLKIDNINMSVVHNIAKRNYMTIMPITLTVPEGFKGPYVPHANSVLSTLADFENISSRVTRPTINALAAMLSNPDQMRSATGNILTNVDTKERPIKGFKASMATYFEPHSESNSATYGQLFGNNSGFIEGARVAQHIGDQISSSDTGKELRTVSSDIDELSDLIDKLIVRLKQDPSTYQMNARIAAQVADSVDTVADIVTFYGALIQMAQETHGTIVAATSKLK